jgi:ribosomal protein S18 acetylase RimI-like enzyme
MTRTQPGGTGRPSADLRLNGPAAAIRPARAVDQAALGDFFAALSPRTRYLRFFAPVTPGPALLRLLSGTADGAHAAGTADAVVAVRGGVIIGHAMAADRLGPHGRKAADIGIVVADAWQGRGVGSALMRALVTRAQARGVTTLTMDVLSSNHQVVAMIGAHWPAARIDPAPDGLAIRIRLQDQHQHQQPSAATA